MAAFAAVREAAPGVPEAGRRPGGEAAMGGRVFLLLLPVPTLPVSRVARVGSAQILPLRWVGRWLVRNRYSAASARGPGAESQVRPILIFARHCLLPDIGHLFRASAALFTRAEWPGRSEPPIQDQCSRPAQSRTEGGGRAGMLCGSLGLAGGRILRGTAPKARRDGANASFFRIRPSVYIQAEL